jgi:alpha-1,3-fucosyltransferase
MFKHFLKINFILIICLVIVLSIVYYFNFGCSSQSYKYLFDKIIIKSDYFPCDPLIKEASQYYAFIDNEFYPKIVPSYFNESLNFTCLNSPELPLKRILLWNNFFSTIGYGYGVGVKEPFIKNHCPVHNCEIATDQSLLHSSDLVIVHMRGNGLNSIRELNRKRLPQNRLVFFLAESPMHSAEFENFNGIFNLSATFKLDSYFASYAIASSRLKWTPNNEFNSSNDFHSSKTKLATIFVSNCHDNSKRLELIKEMKKYINVDVYGSCGDKELRTRCGPNCSRETLSHSYMFYLAFENSLCNDYITEKFYDSLRYNWIPVVLGKGSYDHWIPKSGYIDVRDFQTIKDLTDFMLYLSENSTAYNSYFEWKKHVKILDWNYRIFCDMCIKLNLETFYGVKESVIDNMKEFWSRRVNCKRPSIKNGSYLFEDFT